MNRIVLMEYDNWLQVNNKCFILNIITDLFQNSTLDLIMVSIVFLVSIFTQSFEFNHSQHIV